MSALDILLKHGLDKRAPEASKAYQGRLKEIDRQAEKSGRDRVDEMRKRIKGEQEAKCLERAVRHQCVQSVVRIYPSAMPFSSVYNDRLMSQRRALDPTKLLGKQEEGAGADNVAPSDDGKWIIAYEVSTLCSPSSEYLNNLIAIYPNINNIFSGIEGSKWRIEASDFKSLKERMLILESILQGQSEGEAPAAKREELIKAVLDEGHTRSTADLLKKLEGSNKPHSGSLVSTLASVASFFIGSDSGGERFADAGRAASSMDNPYFLSHLSIIVEREPLLTDAAQRAKDMAVKSLIRSITKRTHELVDSIQKIQIESCKAHVKQEVTNHRNRDTELARVEFLKAFSDMPMHAHSK